MEPICGNRFVNLIMIQIRKLNLILQKTLLIFCIKSKQWWPMTLPSSWRGDGEANWQAGLKGIVGNLRRVCRRGTSCQGWPINLCIFCSSSAGIYFVLIALLLDSLSLNDFHRSGLRSENLIFHISRWNVFPGWRVSSEMDAGPVSSLCTVFFYCKKLRLISARGGTVLRMYVCVGGRGGSSLQSYIRWKYFIVLSIFWYE